LGAIGAGSWLTGLINRADKKTLIIIAESNKNLYLSSRNLSQSKVVTVSELNTYDILNASNIVLAEGSVKAIEETLLSN
jgi:large subunit ribosomal protein L4